MPESRQLGGTICLGSRSTRCEGLEKSFFPFHERVLLGAKLSCWAELGILALLQRRSPAVCFQARPALPGAASGVSSICCDLGESLYHLKGRPSGPAPSTCQGQGFANLPALECRASPAELLVLLRRSCSRTLRSWRGLQSGGQRFKFSSSAKLQFPSQIQGMSSADYFYADFSR